MLEKLESGYLSLLRMVILVVASLSLIVALGALALAILSLVRSTGVTSAEASGGNLAEFIEQQKPLASTGASSNTSTMEIAALPDVRTAAANFKTYLGNRSKIKEDEFVEALQHGADEFGADGALYAEGVKLLSEELKISAGQPLSETRVLQLIDRHHVMKARLRDCSKAALVNPPYNCEKALSAVLAAACAPAPPRDPSSDIQPFRASMRERSRVLI